MHRPKALRQGSRLRIVSPASGPWTRSELDRGLEGLRALGFKAEASERAYRNHYYLAGTDEERAADLMAAFLDPDVDGVVCSQGGYGSARLFGLLDFDAIAANPKPFVGYSDITSLHLMLGRLSGLCSFHGPGATGFERSWLSDYSKSAWLRALTEPGPVGAIGLADPLKETLAIRPGVAEGPLVGGNLTLVCASLGTPYEIDARGAILFFEELDTEPWILDHMLSHLANAGKFREAAGLVIGEWENCEPNKLDPGFFNQRSAEDVLYDYFGAYAKPVLYGLPLSHAKDKATLPLGVLARLDAGAGLLELLESGTTA